MSRLTTALLIFWVGYPVAWATEPAKPEVMFMIDTSGSMQHTYRNDTDAKPFATCATSSASASNGTHRLSMMNMIQNVLVGAPILPSGEDSQRCIYDVLETSQAEHAAAQELYNTESGFLRAYLKPSGFDVSAGTNKVGYITAERACCMQSNASGCAVWRICKRDDEREAFRTDGLIQQYKEQYKFGLMTTDGDPSADESFGEDEDDGQLRVAQQYLLSPVIAKFYSQLRGQPIPTTPNLGILPMSGNVPDRPAGSFVPPHLGTLIDSVVNDVAIVGELPRQLQAHSDYVIRRIRGLRPSGFGARQAMMRDYRKYVEASQKAGLLKDPREGCRKRVLIMLMNTRAMKTYHSQPCLPNDNEEGAGTCPPRLPYPYRGLAAELDSIAQIPNLSTYYLAFGLSDEKQAELSQVLGPSGEVIGLKDEADLRQQVSRILAGLNTDKTSYRMPLIVSPRNADQVEDVIRQYRITGYAEGAAGGRYGRIDVSAFGCPSAGGQDPVGRLRPLLAQSYQVAEKLALQATTSSFASHPSEDRSFGLTGTREPSIVDPGKFAAQPNIDEGPLRTMLDLGENAALDDVYEMLRAYFGDAVRPDNEAPCKPICGLPPNQPQRQLGTIEYGRFVAAIPPRFDLPGDAYQAFETAQRKRPTLFISGASDGKIHFFRLADGRELFSFVPNAALRALKSGVAQPGMGALKADGDLVIRNMIACRSIGQGNDACPSDPENFQILHLLNGAIGRGAPNLFGVDLTKLTDTLAEGENNLITIDDVRTWDVVEGFPNPNTVNQANWDEYDAVRQNQN